MLQNIKPQPKHAKSKEGSLTEEEKSLAKGLLKLGYRAQDITFVMNQGRSTTVNQARVSEVGDNPKIDASDKATVNRYLKVQQAYDPKTLLNPYKDERLIRAREAMIAAVQIFNSPAITFKTEIFSVLANIGWTYLLHEKMEKTLTGSSALDAHHSVTLGGTLGKDVCPIKQAAVVENLKMVIKIRDSVEHTFFADSDACFGALFQACCINFEKHITEWFGAHLSLAKDLSLALQFVRLSKDQVIQIENTNFPEQIRAIQQDILNSQFVNDDAFQLNVLYTTEVASKTTANIQQLVKYEEGKNYPLVAIKKESYTRCTQIEVVKKIRAKGYKKFTTQRHQEFWQKKWGNSQRRKTEATEYGEVLAKNVWFWYLEMWLPVVLEHCSSEGDRYK